VGTGGGWTEAGDIIAATRVSLLPTGKPSFRRRWNLNPARANSYGISYSDVDGKIEKLRVKSENYEFYCFTINLLI